MPVKQVREKKASAPKHAKPGNRGQETRALRAAGKDKPKGNAIPVAKIGETKPMAIQPSTVPAGKETKNTTGSHPGAVELDNHVFTLKHGGQKHKVALNTVEPSKPELKGLNTTLRMSCTAYRRGDDNAALTFQGLTLKGEVPVKELVRWARTKGYLVWERNGGNGNGSNAKPGRIAKVSGAARGRGQR